MRSSCQCCRIALAPVTIVASSTDELQGNFRFRFLDDQVGEHREQEWTGRAGTEAQVAIGTPTRVSPLLYPRQIATPSLVQPFQDVKVSVCKDDCQRVVRTPSLKVLGDVDTAFPIEKSRCVGDFVAR